MELTKMYSNLIIAPLEKEVKNLRYKVYSKKFSFTRKTDKKHLDKMEKLLYDYYTKFAIFVDKELELNDKKDENT